MAEFEIKVTELEAGGKDYAFPLRSAWLASVIDTDELRVDPNADGTVTFRADKSGNDVIVRGHIHGALVTECARCLGEARIPVDTELVALLVSRSGAARPVVDDVELTPEELDREFYTGDTISLDSLVRENVLLEVPMQPLCSEDCKGIEVPEKVRGPRDLAAPEPGAPKIDPRLAPLLALTGKNGAAPAPDGAAPGKAKKTKRAR